MDVDEQLPIRRFFEISDRLQCSREGSEGAVVPVRGDLGETPGPVIIARRRDVKVHLPGRSLAGGSEKAEYEEEADFWESNHVCVSLACLMSAGTLDGFRIDLCVIIYFDFSSIDSFSGCGIFMIS